MKIDIIENSNCNPAGENLLHKFKVGQIGIIREWNGDDVGAVVMIRGDDLQLVSNVLRGKEESPWILSWTQLCSMHGAYYIEALSPGTVMKVTL